MKGTTIILVPILAAGLAWAQNPQIIQNTRTMMNTVQKNNTAASNEALGITNHPATKPAATATKSVATVKPAASTKPSTASAAQVKPASASAAQTKPAVKPASATAAQTKSLAVKPAVKSGPVKTAVAAQKHTKKAAKAEKKPVIATKPSAAATPASAPAASSDSAEAAKSDSDDSQDKKWSMTGKRDPFISPVVNHAGGSGCSTGKKCLEIGAINLRGVVHSDSGFIAVVTNNMNKAYFLRENDPVFDGYVVKITGDSIVFQETMQDRLGKTFTREVVKKITTPAV